MMGARDLLIATSFSPYAPETAQVATAAKERKARIIAISDSRLSPIAGAADLSFEIKDAEVRQFRSLTASLCLAQTLVISYAFELEGKPARSEPIDMIRFALFGAGRIGRIHAGNIARHPRARLAYVVDADARAAAARRAAVRRADRRPGHRGSPTATSMRC